MVRPPARFGEASEEEERDTSQDLSMVLSDQEQGQEEPRIVSRNTSHNSLSWDSFEHPTEFEFQYQLDVRALARYEELHENNIPVRYCSFEQMMTEDDLPSPRWSARQRRERSNSI